MTRRKPRAQQGVQSVETGGKLLQALERGRGPQMLKDLARRAQMPPAKAHRYLVSLARLGLVEQDPATGQYDLGAFAMSLGLAALARLEPVSVAAGQLPALTEATGLTAAIAVFANHGPTMVRWQGADTPVSASLRVGSVMPLSRSATGLCFLAFGDGEACRPLLTAELAANRRQGLAPGTAQELEPALAATRARGYAMTSGFIPGICGIAAPVRDSAGTLALALVVLGYVAVLERDRDRVIARVLEAAASISARLGAPPVA